MSKVTRRNFTAALQVGRCITRTFATNRPATAPDNYVTCKQNNGVRTLTLNQPATHNLLSLGMLKALLDGICRNEDSKDLRSIVINSVPGKVFSAGHNLKELTTQDGSERHKEIFETCSKLMNAISQSQVPVIAAVDGLAAAAGCQLVVACDIAICTERSSFSTPGANIGIFCSTPGIPLLRNVQRKTAMYMLFTGFSITGKEAYEVGLVSRVVPNDKLDDEVAKVTNAINSKSRAVIHSGKTFLYKQLDLDAEKAYLLATKEMVNNLKLKDAQEGIMSFIEKRKPQWCHGFDKDQH